MPEYMPMVATHARVGALRAVGEVTGTPYLVTPQGTWVWLEDLPGLLAELRAACCNRGDRAVPCFFRVNPTSQNAVPYRPWPGAEVEAIADESSSLEEKQADTAALEEAAVATEEEEAPTDESFQPSAFESSGWDFAGYEYEEAPAEEVKPARSSHKKKG